MYSVPYPGLPGSLVTCLCGWMALRDLVFLLLPIELGKVLVRIRRVAESPKPATPATPALPTTIAGLSLSRLALLQGGALTSEHP